jgi:hypothetical protein
MSQLKRAWCAPIALGLLCLTPFLVPQETDAQALLSRLHSGDCEALPLLANLHPEELTLELMTALARHEDHDLRELVGHQDWIPHINLRNQLTVAATLEPAEVRQRAMIWIGRRSTSREALTLLDIGSYWDSRNR